MPRIDGKGNIIPDGAPAPPPELSGSTILILGVVAAVILAFTVPSDAKFHHHIDNLTQRALQQGLLVWIYAS